MVKFERAWHMPCADTFSMKPAQELALRYIDGLDIIVDPFARNSKLVNVTNDLSEEFDTDYHMEAQDFLDVVRELDITADAVILDPPYSPRQMSEAYKSVGLKKGMAASQNAKLYRECKDKINLISRPGTICITAGWNSSGMGKKRGWEMLEILLVCCGGAHNDYIFVVERKLEDPQASLWG